MTPQREGRAHSIRGSEAVGRSLGFHQGTGKPQEGFSMGLTSAVKYKYLTHISRISFWLPVEEQT